MVFFLCSAAMGRTKAGSLITKSPDNLAAIPLQQIVLILVRKCQTKGPTWNTLCIGHATNGTEGLKDEKPLSYAPRGGSDEKIGWENSGFGVACHHTYMFLPVPARVGFCASRNSRFLDNLDAQLTVPLPIKPLGIILVLSTGVSRRSPVMPGGEGV